MELTVPFGIRRPTGRIRVHTTRVLPEHHVKRPAAIPTTSVARTLADLAAALNPKQIERALDNCLASNLVTIPAMWRTLRDLSSRGRAGICSPEGTA